MEKMKVKYINLNKEKKEQLVFDSPGNYVVFFHNYSGNIICDINVSGVSVDIFGLYDGKNNEEFIVHTVQHHNSPNSTSNLFVKGVLADSSKFKYSGLIRIEKEGQGSHAYQKNQNLMVSKKAFVQSEPYLEILANDVFCTHGSTTGKLNEEQLYYAMSRGLNYEKAKEVLIEGFKNEVVEKVKQLVPDFQM
jgi:Fe-S cluster assembly protein SufD